MIAAEENIPLTQRKLITPARLRHWLTRKGPIFIKLGQFLALRPDIIPQEYCDELIKLLDHIPFSPWYEVKDVLTQELGRDPEEVFTSINKRPIGAGSLAQVHLASLPNGKEVIIKVLRPGIDRQIEKNLKHARLLLKLLSIGPLKLPISSNELINELSHWLYQELDFSREMANLTRLYHLSKNSPQQTVPQPYPQWSSRRVIITEYLEGVPLSEIIHLVQTKAYEHLARLHINPDEVAKNLLESCLTQMFDFHFFHMDLHPGNLIILPDNTLGFVDFGLCGYLDSTINARQVRYFSAMLSGHSEDMFHAAIDILETDEFSDEEAFKRDFYTQTSVWQARQPIDVSTNHVVPSQNSRSRTGEWLVQIMRSARKANMRIPTGVLAMYRTLLTAESVCHLLSTKHSLPSVGKRYFVNHQTKEITRSLSPENLQPLMVNIIGLLRDSPGRLERILADISERRFTINANVNDTNKNRKAANQRFRLLALSILSVGLTILLTIDNLPVVFGIAMETWLVSVLIFVYMWILLLWRQLK
ncbi:hypothetical protein AB835_14570 [Candidatus Endobugula sertula]|uniref:Protein kinase domain-containing protein n=1 Tax=Candidatus Endobugula sertula TaxID=62101 RepID=A0A1D2QLB8_9GAMM|nr:hypothetical protein AB835_14570 [Candidatus Endobugula sertula]